MRIHGTMTLSMKIRGTIALSMRIHGIIALLLTASLVLALAACGGTGTAGKYVLVDVKDDPDGITFSEIEGMYRDMDMNVSSNLYLELLSGGRFTLVMFGEEEASGTYTREGGTLMLNALGTTMTAAISGRRITWTYESGANLIFEKK